MREAGWTLCPLSRSLVPRGWVGINWGLEGSLPASCILGRSTLKPESQAVLPGLERGALRPLSLEGSSGLCGRWFSNPSFWCFSITV